MSFNQYRTNPGQAVSNFKGRTDTPKAWPGTAVSTWLNGGLFGGSSPGWIAVPTASNFNGFLGSHTLDSDNNLYFAIHQGDTANSDGPVGVILSDGTIGNANDWKYIDAKNSRPATTQGICINGSKMFAIVQVANVSNIQATFTCGFTPGTLGPDYNKSWYENNTRDFYAGNPSGSIQAFDADSNIVVGYGLNSYYNRFHVYVSLLSTSTGVVQVLNGGTADTILFESDSGSNSVYPVVSRNSKVGDYIVVQVRYQADRVGWLAQNSTNSAAYRQYYTDSGGTLNYRYGGTSADTQGTNHFYMTTHNGAFAQLSRVQLSNGSLVWNRKIQATTSPSSITTCSQPVVDSSGNIYFAWAQYDNNVVVDTCYRIHWVKYDSSGNRQQIDGKDSRCLFVVPENGQPWQSLNLSLDSTEKFLYITAYNNAATPIVAKIPLDGSGTQAGPYTVGGKNFYYRDDVGTTDSAGTLTAAGTDGSYSTNTETTQSDTLYNATTQISGAAVASIEVA